MEIRVFALRIVESKSIEEKLASVPQTMSDADPVPAHCPLAPARPEALRIVRVQDAKVPARAGMADPAQRVRILHAFANHELQAVELCAWALLAFPHAPAEFRSGLLRVLADEQAHLRMYMARLAHFGCGLGDWPVSGYFWSKVARLRTPLQYVCAMALTFENANLDHTVDYAHAARAAGDTGTAAILDRVHADEVRHVRFGWEWLRSLKERSESMWEAYERGLTWPLAPERARGATFHPEGRRAAGFDVDFIERLRALHPYGAFGGRNRPVAVPPSKKRRGSHA